MKQYKSKPRRIWRTLGISFVVLVSLLMLAVVALVFNPLEGSLRDVPDVVPREVDFFLRKRNLIADFADEKGRFQLQKEELPAPAFWQALVESDGFTELRKGPVVSDLTRSCVPVLVQARDALLKVQQDSSGMIDLARDLAGQEMVIAGYYEDKTKQPFQPLQQPWWCLYARISWRVRFGWGLACWSIVQSQLRSQGLDVQAEGEILVIRGNGIQGSIYAARRLDCLMLANNKYILEQSLRLVDGNDQEQPFGQSARYADGVTHPIERWSDVNTDFGANAVEFSLAPNTVDPFRRFSMAWPNEANKDSMNERVLASFLKLAGWNSITGAFLFEPQRLSVLGEVVLNSHMHTKFQQSFYKAEKQARSEWLDPFLRMVPDTACAAAALRMPVGEFLRAMNGALQASEKSLLNDALRNCTLQKQQLADSTELIEKLSIAFLPRAGFVFRRNVPDKSINPETKQQWIPDPIPSPMPQIAWIFWLRPGQRAIAEDFVDMLSRHASVFRFSPLHLKVDGLPEPVTEFVNPQIPGTGELAMIVFNDFMVMSNSGPLVKDILRTRYSYGQLRPLIQNEAYQSIERELPRELNGFVWLNGSNLIPVLDDYRKASQVEDRDPDMGWMVENRANAERMVLQQTFTQYKSLASMPQQVRNGEFADAVAQYLREQWAKGAAGINSSDLPAIAQLRAMATMFDSTYLRVDLENNYIRFQGKVITKF